MRAGAVIRSAFDRLSSLVRENASKATVLILAESLLIVALLGWVQALAD